MSRMSPADRAELNELWTELTNALRKIERLLGDDDPTGLTYSRDDDEPLAALLPPGIEGVAFTGRPRGHNSSPTGFASDTRREASSVGAKQPEVGLGRTTAGMGTAELGGPAVPTLRGCAR